MLRKKIAVIGTGISGMSAAWLLSQAHDVTVYEQNQRLGGHSNTVTVDTSDGPVPVDTGFIVYNEVTYPNLTALFAYLDVPTQQSEMSFAVSLSGCDLEYSGGSFSGLFAQRSNLFSPRFWSMLTDLWRFYREAPRALALIDEAASLQDYLEAGSYGSAFRDDHLLPMAAAIWSSSPSLMLKYPAASFIRFHHNHGLLKILNRPKWKTVTGGSIAYIRKIMNGLDVRLDAGVATVRRIGSKIEVRCRFGVSELYDDVVIATHADAALALLEHPTVEERRALGAFQYSQNRAVLHRDTRLMPRRRSVWASWNYIGENREVVARNPAVTYWMNALQSLPTRDNLFVTLNPSLEPQNILHEECYDHPIFDAKAIAAQKQLWSLQGKNQIWFCGAYFGSGFHEDGLQAGLAVAEKLGKIKRPWNVRNESGRIYTEGQNPMDAEEAA